MDPQVGQSLDGLFFSLCSTLYLPIYSCEYFVPPSKKAWSTHTLVFLLEIHVGWELYLGIPSFWANIHLSVSAYHVVFIMYLLFETHTHMKMMERKYGNKNYF